MKIVLAAEALESNNKIKISQKLKKNMEMRMLSGDASVLETLFPEMVIKQEENDELSEVKDFLACSKAHHELRIYQTYDSALDALRRMRNAEDSRMLVKYSQSFLSLVKLVLKYQKDYENQFSVERDTSESNLMKISSKGWNTLLLNHIEENRQLTSNALNTENGRVGALLLTETIKNAKICFNLLVDRRNFN
ncbi:uncharacterized protein LOC116346481 [Contarinia nasturtii]|uniref:uncharacterized protein LOC116346481 n=1 Tax=Contarinia nasturtii TaxID=265458 RepID=UPI0012D4A66B|nr:uncharacterized protein LOC116346481 [Contarinia nasturtii]